MNGRAILETLKNLFKTFIVIYNPYSKFKEMDFPVDGIWGTWQSWTNCLATCGDGKRIRTRYCNSPIPTNGGLFCDQDGSQNYDVGNCQGPPCKSIKTSYTIIFCELF